MKHYLVKLDTRLNGHEQLAQCLEEEKKAGYIKGYEIINQPSIITSIAELKRIAKGQGYEFALLLNGGLRSSKFIKWMPKFKKFSIFNYIDGTEQQLTEAELSTHSNIGEAIKKRALMFEN